MEDITSLWISSVITSLCPTHIVYMDVLWKVKTAGGGVSHGIAHFLFKFLELFLLDQQSLSNNLPSLK